MPNWSHGLAGIAGVLARAGVALDRPDLVEAARRGAEHLVTLADPASLADGGLAVPRRIPHKPDMDEYTWNWCHGPAGNLALFEALETAGVRAVAGEPPTAWVGRCLHSLHTSGIPERRWPGFWDNDGRCCGTAGVGGRDPAARPRLRARAGRRPRRAGVRRGRPRLLAVHRAPQPRAAQAAWCRMDAGRRRHRGVPVRRVASALSRAAAGGRPSPSARPCRRPTSGR